MENKRLSIVCIDQESLGLETGGPQKIPGINEVDLLTFTTLYLETLSDGLLIYRALKDLKGLSDIRSPKLRSDGINRKNYHKKYIIDIDNPEPEFKRISDRLLKTPDSGNKVTISLVTTGVLEPKDISIHLVNKGITDVAIVYVKYFVDNLIIYSIDGK